MKIHFIGIGGIGVSALARYYLEKGHKVSGSDLISSEITDSLKRLGAKIFVGSHNPKHLKSGVDQVVYSPAVQKNNPELKEAKRRRIKTQSYPEALGELTKKYWTIAVSGTHGKSTTTAMIGLLLEKAGFDPTVIVGTKLKEFENSNCRVGKSKYLVIEADEWRASFLNYWPQVIVLTNIEKEHLDYFKNLNNILKTYKKYLKQLPLKNETAPVFSGVIANKDDKKVYRIVKEVQKNYPTGIKWYSLRQKEEKKLKKILKIPGEHNIYNALAALTLARELKIPDKATFQALSDYQGSWRRFEIKQAKINNKQLTIIDDYAHHPTEIRVTLKAAREKFPKKEIWVVFQPHQYQRTFYLFNDFVKVFRKAPIDKLIITDIYDVAGREEKKIREKINSKKLVEAINKGRAIYRAHKDLCASVYLKKREILGYLRKNLSKNSIVIIMGAGDIYKLCKQF